MARQHHIGLGPEHLEGNGGLGRYVLLPGDPSRAAKIAEAFDDPIECDNSRGYVSFSGTLPSSGEGGSIDVLTLATGVGSASAEVALQELIACGARRLVRVGSCGAMVPEVQPGQVVIVTAAVRDERTTHHYAPPEFPAVAHPEAVAAMSEGARRAGLADETFTGVCHSKASLYAREFGRGPAGKHNLDYCRWLRNCGAIATEMEASTLFILATTTAPGPLPLSRSLGAPDCRATAVLAVFAPDHSQMRFDEEVARAAEERAIRVAVEGVRTWAEMDRAGRGQGPSDR